MTLVEYVHDGVPADEPTLDELAATANREHSLATEHAQVAVRAAATSVEHAIRCGEALLALQSRMGRGEWTPWVRNDFVGSEITAQTYMRLARHRDRVEGIPTIREALATLHGLPRPNGGPVAYPAEIRLEAIRLHDEEGWAWPRVSEHLGIKMVSLRNWIYPTPRPGESKRAARARAARAALRREEEAQAIRRAVRKAGAATQEAWAMAERLQDVLAQAQRETEDREARRAISEAGVHYRKMRDEIVRALGVA